MPPIRLLFIRATHPNDVRLDADVEQRNLQESLHHSRGRVEITLCSLPAARIGDLPRYLRDHSPHIVHIACHGDGDGGLELYAPDDAASTPLSGDDLAAIIANYQAEAEERLRLVVLAGCWTGETARLLAEQVDWAVGFAGAVADEDVRDVFTPQFYAALSSDRTAPNAVATAATILRSQGMVDTAETVQVYSFPAKDSPPLPPSRWPRLHLSPAHLDYLKLWFGKPWADVSLADILDQKAGAEQKASLLDIYVPLPVDFGLTLQVQDGKIVDWWAAAEKPEQTAEQAAAREAAGAEQGQDDALLEPQKLAHRRTWPALGVEEDALQPIVAEIQRKIDARRAAGKATKDGEHFWTMEAHYAAGVQPRFVLLGEPGSGKSSFLRHLALCLAGELRRQAGDAGAPAKASLAALRDWLLDAYTPIYVELRDLVRTVFAALPETNGAPLRLPEVEDFWRYVGGIGGARLTEPGGELRRLCDAGQAVLLLDGLDEVSGAGSEARRKQIKALIAALVRTYPHLRVIVAGRPHAYRSGEWLLEGFGVAQLRPLSLDRLSELARALFPAVLGEDGAAQADQFIAAVRQQLQDQRIEADFYANPLFFTLLAGIWLAPSSGRRLPETRAELYRRSVDLLLSRWTRRRLPDQSVADDLGLAPETMRSVLETLACSIYAQRAVNEDTTRFRVSELLGVLYDAGCKVLVHDVPDYLSQHTGLLSSPEHGWLYFTHRSFQEHLAACELICRTPDDHLPPVVRDRRFPDGLLQRVLVQPELWENVARLAADELVAQGRMRELGGLLAAMSRPYSKDEQAPLAALLALTIMREQSLFAVDADDLDMRPSEREALHRTALKILVDWKHYTPEQRNSAGELLGVLPALDTRPGVGLRDDRLPDIDWVEVPEVDAQGRREFIYQEDGRRVEPTFWMARYLVTYGQFHAFVEAADGYRDARWWEGLAASEDVRRAPADQRFRFWNHPRENVTWYAAVAFCRWLTWQAKKKRDLLPPALQFDSDWRISLPTEWQWEKAARGHEGRRYPWGEDKYRSGYGNIDETVKSGDREPVGKHYLQKTSAVGMYPQGASPDGIQDLSGNVWEWCLNEYSNPDHVQEVGDETLVLRGGSWNFAGGDAAAVARNWDNPNLVYISHGFRVVVGAVPVPAL